MSVVDSILCFPKFFPSWQVGRGADTTMVPLAVCLVVKKFSQCCVKTQCVWNRDLTISYKEICRSVALSSNCYFLCKVYKPRNNKEKQLLCFNYVVSTGIQNFGSNNEFELKLNNEFIFVLCTHNIRDHRQNRNSMVKYGHTTFTSITRLLEYPGTYVFFFFFFQYFVNLKIRKII